MQKITIAGRISPEWYTEIQTLMESTGQSQTDIVNEAIGLYLKKSKRLQVVSRLDALEKRVGTIAAMVVQ